jgi:hypothetical protein
MITRLEGAEALCRTESRNQKEVRKLSVRSLVALKAAAMHRRAECSEAERISGQKGTKRLFTWSAGQSNTATIHTREEPPAQSQGSKIVSNKDDQDCQAAEKKQNQRKLAAQSHGSKIIKLRSSKIIIE